MADRKISDLTALTAQASGDLIPIVDVSEAAAADKNKSITVQELFRGIPVNVGVGTASPSAPLTVTSSGGTNVRLVGRDNGTTDEAQLYFVHNDDSTVHGIIEGKTTSLNFYGGTTLAQTIDSSGNVGIGTSSPVNLLHIQGDATFEQNAGGQFAIRGSTNSSNRFNFGFDTTSNYAWLQAITAGTSYRPIALNPAGGNVGIGSTAPGEKLTIEDTANPGIRLVDQTTANTKGLVRFANGTLRIDAQYDNSSGVIAFTRNATATESARIDTSGRLLVGTASSSASGTIFAQGNSSSSTGPASLFLAKGDNAPSNGATIGLLRFSGNTHVHSAEVAAFRDGGTWTAGSSLPTGLVFSTTADGASSPTERMRIESNGQVSITQADNYNGFFVNNTNASVATNVTQFRTSRANNSAFQFSRMVSASGTDIEFNFRGDGNAYADGSWNGGGADYAEYFEWSDSNTNAEDRRGISVVLDGDKIREAVAGEEPIGVISGNPSVVGDAAWNKWNGKYLRDDFGTYIRGAEGERQLNPDYDPDVEYVSREDRPEWDCVGLMGKLRIRKGQVTGARWIKMRDISDNVEEWLVR